MSHFYQTSDGWIFLDSNQEELTRLNQIEGLEGIEDSQDKASFIQQCLLKAPTSYWVDMFVKADIAAAEPMAIEDLREQNSRIADDTVGTDKGSFAFSIYPDHPSGHCITQIDQYAIRPTESSIKAVTPTEAFGYSTRAVLTELGYQETDINEMLATKVAGLGWGKEFLPS